MPDMTARWSLRLDLGDRGGRRLDRGDGSGLRDGRRLVGKKAGAEEAEADTEQEGQEDSGFVHEDTWIKDATPGRAGS